MRMRSRAPREVERLSSGGGSSAKARLPDPGSVTDVRLAGQLRGPQLQRLAETLQGTLGNQGAGAVLGDVQRTPASSQPESSGRPSPKTIQVLSARLVQKPSFIAATIVVLSRGDQVTPTGEQKGGWHRVVTADGAVGWIHQSAWQTSRPKLTSAPGAGGGEPPEEIEIAGRG